MEFGVRSAWRSQTPPPPTFYEGETTAQVAPLLRTKQSIQLCFLYYFMITFIEWQIFINIYFSVTPIKLVTMCISNAYHFLCGRAQLLLQLSDKFFFQPVEIITSSNTTSWLKTFLTSNSFPFTVITCGKYPFFLENKCWTNSDQIIFSSPAKIIAWVRGDSSLGDVCSFIYCMVFSLQNP